MLSAVCSVCEDSEHEIAIKVEAVSCLVVINPTLPTEGETRLDIEVVMFNLEEKEAECLHHVEIFQWC